MQRAIVDTGSFDTVVKAVSCKVCGGNPRYDKTKSEFFDPEAAAKKNATWIHYGSGDAEVLPLQDLKLVRTGDHVIQGIGVVEEVTNHNIQDLRSDDFDAIVGVGPC